jgi:hypothetical protein
MEVCAWLITDVKDFVVQDAGWEVARHPILSSKRESISEILGIKAYLRSGGSIKKALAGKGDTLLFELLCECVRGFVQTVSLMQKEHGYASTSEYASDFQKDYKNACRLYNNNQNKIAWNKRTYYQPAEIIFNRVNSVSIEKEVCGDFKLVSHFSDSHQQLASQIATDQQGIVRTAEGFYLRLPDPRCGENVEHFPKLIGCCLLNMDRKTLGAIVGGSSGCDHLVSMLYSTTSAFRHMLRV